MREAMLKVNTKLAQVPDYPEDAKEPVINTSNAADRPIAWFILSQRVPDRAEADKLLAQHPELKPAIDKAYAAKSEGLADAPPAAAGREGARAWQPGCRRSRTFRRSASSAEDFIEAAFERVEGVSNANVLGGREEELQLVIDPQKLAARNLTINHVRQALRTQNEDTSGGDYWEGKRRYVVRTLGQFRSPEQVENVILTRDNGMPGLCPRRGPRRAELQKARRLCAAIRQHVHRDQRPAGGRRERARRAWTACKSPIAELNDELAQAAGAGADSGL